MNTTIAFQLFIGLTLVIIIQTINGLIVRFREEVGYTPYEIAVLETIKAMDNITDTAITCHWLINRKESP